jgi:hypothetical protein
MACCFSLRFLPQIRQRPAQKKSEQIGHRPSRHTCDYRPPSVQKPFRSTWPSKHAARAQGQVSRQHFVVRRSWRTLGRRVDLQGRSRHARYHTLLAAQSLFRTCRGEPVEADARAFQRRDAAKAHRVYTIFSQITVSTPTPEKRMANAHVHPLAKQQLGKPWREHVANTAAIAFTVNCVTPVCGTWCQHSLCSMGAGCGWQMVRQ